MWGRSSSPRLYDAAITVEGRRDGELFAAALQSPPTRSAPADPVLVTAALRLFALEATDLDPRIPPAAIHAGAVARWIGRCRRPLEAALGVAFCVTGVALLQLP